MKQKIKLLLRFLRKFGLWKGLKLYLKFFTGKVGNIKLPDIQYPFSLRNRSSDIPVFYQVFFDNQYQITFTKSPRIIIDGGANIGLFAVKMKNKYPEAKIICVEPDSENFQLLQKNLAPYNEIHYENAGLWSKDTRLRVYDKHNLGKWGVIVEEDLNEPNVNGISLKSLFEKHSIEYVDILKLDIEGSEKKLFSENYEVWLPKVKTIIIEIHDWMEEGCSKSFFEAINKSFKNYKYSISGGNTVIINKDMD